MISVDTYSIALIVATLILAGLTGYYAIQTRSTVRVLEKTAELSVRPSLKGNDSTIRPSKLRFDDQKYRQRTCKHS